MKLIGAFLSVVINGGLVLALTVYAVIETVGATLPDYKTLANWQPALSSRLYAGDGSQLAEFAREKRLFIPIGAVPLQVRGAFLAAEDKNFYSHSGIDPLSIGKAIISNVGNALSGERLIGASTITQQVAKNFLLTTDRTFERKLKEALLAVLINQAFTKDQLLELYLNDIYLGAGAYGVAQAALTYFGKGVGALSVAEAAYLAALPKGPNNYHPLKAHDRAIARRNWVIEQMVSNRFITNAVALQAMGEPLKVSLNEKRPEIATAEFFTEEVRRFLLAQYGEAELYTAGFSVRTTLDPVLQHAAMRALRKGLVEYDQVKGYRGPIAHLANSAEWPGVIRSIAHLADVPEWQLSMVTRVGAEGIVLRPEGGVETSIDMDLKALGWALCRPHEGKKRCFKDAAKVFSVGDIVYVEKTDVGHRLRQPPQVQGALVSMEPRTGRVVAMAGGFSYAQSQFNRATQAYRQPGSSFKPFVYAAALDAGYTPTTLVLDAPLAIPDGAGRIWRPKNYDGRSGGASTLRTGLETSRNQMTVRLARAVGMNVVADYSKRFGLYDDLKEYLPMSLGAGETTLMRLVSAYAVIANGGLEVHASLIDRIQNRDGRTIFRQDERRCEDCNAEKWNEQPEPTVIDDKDYVLDPMTAYQITSMLQGVVQRGTARSVSVLGVPVAGKTGTTNDEKDVWFVGYTPDLVTGVFMGYDTPKPMGYGETGGGLAGPIFIDFMKTALAGRKAGTFHQPDGMILRHINRRRGNATEKQAGSFVEAFKPGTGPCAGQCGVIDDVIDLQTAPSSEQLDDDLRDRLLRSTGGLY
ncbi:penicillin-binding protein 1A [Pararhizobium sp. PWRC1-1]|uniref:penicillin-binding protein 1A n=1 Tax=Pararhizobium sp. PWRC1-1 TaxID=2804566 RepID=UPI003CEEF165